MKMIFKQGVWAGLWLLAVCACADEVNLDGVWCGQGEVLSLRSSDSPLQPLAKRCVEFKMASSNQDMGVGHWIGQWYLDEKMAEVRSGGEDMTTVGVFAYSRDASGQIELRMLPLLDDGVRENVVLDQQGKLRIMMYRYAAGMRVHQAGVASMFMEKDGNLLPDFHDRWQAKYKKTLDGLGDVVA